MNFQKQSSPGKNGADIWVLYNAWRKQDGYTPADEAAVEDQLRLAIEALRALCISPKVYAIASVADLAVRVNGPERPRLVLNFAEAFHGDARKEMHVAALLELLDLPHTGNSAKTLALAQDKALTKRLLEQAGIATPKWAVFEGADFPDTNGLRPPLIAKPAREDASLGISRESVCARPGEIEAAARKLFAAFRQPILIEEYIAGREINAALLQKGGALEVLPFSEILFDGLPDGSPKITSYAAKWNADSAEYTGTPAVCPAAVEPGLKTRLEQTARAVFALLEGKDYGRVDFRVDSAGNPWVLEYNPNPDISSVSGFVRSLRAGGLDFAGFIRVLLENNRYYA